MKIKQTVTAKFNTAYCSWSSLDFTDENGDEIQIQMTDDNYLSLAKTLNVKAERIQKERAEEAAKLAEENSEDE
tara:strand:+ start:323 stop:544 length:222 start_codon:yes stop_codon:yes gene_type:complete